MAQRRRIENPVADLSNDEALNFFFQKAAGELTKLYSLALDSHTAFDAGTRYANMRVYEWIQLQLRNGMSVTEADLLAHLQEKLNEVDGNAQQQAEIEQSANEVVLEDDMHNAHELPEQLDIQSGDTNGNSSASQVEEMEINY
ncbi:hypothetical protein POM88_049454 [Heracleum sosnowskyi]|uniref:Uncharacterized protein n=1 Tax=Heracleum sosnowskyi TaxID=360622 RepID=A0AAD8GX26_9APIA|nr:hypothetical protein POM88_049454 [Heracleum sosnowskyi]